MKHGSLFSGIGGFDLAAEWMGWENLFHCEWNPLGQRVLKYYWPNAESYEDITKTDFTIWRGRIDILTGGFPCQPYSSAGKRLGKDDERHLWPEMLRAIGEISPRWIVGENVLGLTNWNGGLVFEEVCADLEAEGYEVQPYVLPAASVNAPHRRDRVWFVAYSNSSNDGREPRKDESKSGEERLQERNSVRESVESGEISGATSDPESRRTREQQTESKRWEDRRFNDDGSTRNASDPSRKGLQGSKEQGGIKRSRAKRNEQPARFIQSTWKKFPTQSPICGGNDGLPTELDGITFSKWRNESIKAYGNAVVPQVVYQIFKAIEAYETQ